MKHITTVIIGAGQSGLAMSKELAARGVDHVILERGKVANSWRTERWDSLRLLTPNWMNGLPGAPYDGRDPEGYMDMDELVARFDRAAVALSAPIMEQTTVLSVARSWWGYAVQTDQGLINCENVVIATGATSRASRPACAADCPGGIAQFDTQSYKRPADLPAGKVLVVGASASGAQIAREIQLSGREVTIAVGEHIRLPRSYRDADILAWMEITGRWSEGYKQVEDLDRQRRLPSLQLTGADAATGIDLNALQDLGVEIVGRLAGIRDGVAQFSGSLANHCAAADLKMDRLLRGIDDWIEAEGMTDLIDGQDLPDRTRCPASPRLSADLRAEGFASVIWATGYAPDFSWLDLPVFDQKGRLRHDGGHVSFGLYVMGLPFLRRRKSTFIDGACDDARDLAEHLVTNLGRLAAA